MRLRSFSVTLGLFCLLGIGVAPAASADPPTSPDQCSAADYSGDIRLGPEVLARRGPVGRELIGYRRFGGLTSQSFLTRYWDPSAGGTGGWRYPPDDGFVVGPGGRPIEWTSSLPAGLRVDRFGSEYGAFLAPSGTPYARRSLPPQSLHVYDAAYACNYHDYRVIKAFPALTGPIAAAFAQPGGGLQYELKGELIPGAPERLSVVWLVDNGYLSRLN
jgi:hypothetical protein